MTDENVVFVATRRTYYGRAIVTGSDEDGALFVYMTEGEGVGRYARVPAEECHAAEAAARGFVKGRSWRDGKQS